MRYSSESALLTADVCVIGGGMSGICAAVATARHGAKVVLMQDRPVLGGNASSEIRMWMRGAPDADNRETGILSEIELTNIWRNPTMNWSLWDSVLYEAVTAEPNITLLLNCTCLGCECEDGKIRKVRGWQLNSYTFFEISARLFIDCSGDSILADLTDAKTLSGRESRDMYDEPDAPERADQGVMGSSILIQARETDKPQPFIPPSFAYSYPTDEDMHLHTHELTSPGTNFWWIELSEGYDTLRDSGALRDELLRIAYGVWDHLKNHSDGKYDNWELEWLGFLPGKRETRRYEGAYVLREQDLARGTDFPDVVAFGGWTMDNHDPKGFFHHGYSSVHLPVKVPYGIPLRSLYSVNIGNLFFSGRNISATHLALSSTRVMKTCALMGQAAGTAAALCIHYGCGPELLRNEHITELQGLLLEDGCMLPGHLRQVTGEVPDTDPETAEILRNGWERPHQGSENTVAAHPDTVWRISLKPGNRRVLRLALDPDFSRESISDDPAYRKYAMRTHIPLDFKPLKMPAHLLRSATVVFQTSSGEECVQITDNHSHLLRIPVPDGTSSIELKDMRAWNSDETRFFACDVTEG